MPFTRQHAIILLANVIYGAVTVLVLKTLGITALSLFAVLVLGGVVLWLLRITATDTVVYALIGAVLGLVLAFLLPAPTGDIGWMIAVSLIFAASNT